MNLSDNIAVFVRVRKQEGQKSLTTDSEKGVIVLKVQASEDRSFAFDHVGDEATTQDDVFERLGKPLSDQIMAGYNGTIFAYGQTGSGKTYTMGFGSAAAAALPAAGLAPALSDTPPAGVIEDSAGLTPRILDHVFAWIARDERTSDGRLSYRCTGSLLEIHNETITDLLDPPEASVVGVVGGVAHGGCGAGLRLREDALKGVFVEGVKQEEIASAEHARMLLQASCPLLALLAPPLLALRWHLPYSP